VIIPARFSESASALRHDAEVAPTKLLEAIWEAGGEPFVAHPTTPQPQIEELAGRFWMADAILLPGGGDMSPRWYRQEPHPSLYGVNEDQDAFDLRAEQSTQPPGDPAPAIPAATPLDCRVQLTTRSQHADHFADMITTHPACQGHVRAPAPGSELAIRIGFADPSHTLLEF